MQPLFIVFAVIVSLAGAATPASAANVSFAATAAAALAGAFAAGAADTGSISGIVFDAAGQPVADATVSLTGDQLPAGRTLQTGPNGTYQFEYLVPGVYHVTVEKTGTGATRRDAIVDVGKDTQLDAVLGVAVEEELTISASAPVVDTRSSEVAFNFKSDTFSSLPLERTYRGLFQLIPGVPDNRSSIGPAAGGGRQDNTYLIDGANITNPGFGYLSTDVNELDIAEVNVKRAGISAEFGRTSGTVTNAVSRSGTNRFTGLGRLDWLPEQLIEGYRLPDDLLAAGIRPGTFRDPVLTTHASGGGGVGGPIVRDRIFFYGSGRYYRDTKWNRSNKAGTLLPDEISSGPEVFGKVTAVPYKRHQLTATYRERPNHIENAGLTSDTAPSIATTTDNGSRIVTTEWAHFPTSRNSVNVRYLFMTELNEDVPITQLGARTAFNPLDVTAMGQYTDPAQANLIVGGNQFANTQNYRRHEVRGTYTQYFDTGSTSHAFKAGGAWEFGEETFNRTGNGWGLIAAIAQPSGAPALRARYYTEQAPQLGQAHTYSFFAQDDVTPFPRLSLNLGILLNRDDFAQTVDGSNGCPATVSLKGGAAVYESNGDTCTFLRFGFGDEVQPRLGITYSVRSRGDKAYASWGRYYNMDQKSTARSLAPARIYQTQSIFDLNGSLLSSGPLASSTGKLIDPAIEPIHTTEFVVGYATPLGERYTLDSFFMSRGMQDIIEDVPSRINGTAPDSGPFVAVNLPCAAYAACQGADAKRSYRAWTIDLRRRLAGKWTGDASYTWSRFEGNYDLDYALVAVFNTSSIIQDGPGANVQDPNRFGPLSEDRPHVFKLFGAYTPTSRFTASGYFRVQSGSPWNARARDWPGAVLNYLEPAGTHRNPTWANLDVMTSYRLPLDTRARVSLEARVLNVVGNQTRLQTDAQQYLDIHQIPTPPYFAPYTQPNPFFGTGKAFAPPRRLFLAAIVDY